jgi:homoserine kinase type II
MPQKRETLAPEEVAAVLSHYDLGTVTSIRDFIRGAHATAKVVITTDRGKYLLKRRSKGKDDPRQVAFSHHLQKFLTGKNFPLPHLVRTRERHDSVLRLDTAIYEVFEFVEGGPYDGGLRAAYEAGKTLALYHKLVRSFSSDYEPPCGQYHDSRAVYDSFEPLASVLAGTDSVQGRQAEMHDLLARLRSVYGAAAESADSLGLPRWQTQVVHGDWHPGNLLFAKDRVVAVLDYDSIRVWPPVMDTANGCLQFSTVAGGRNLSTWEDRTDHLKAEQFLRGYDETNILSKAELAAIPFLMEEVLIAQAIPVILKTGFFAGLDGLGFLHVTLRKAQWLHAHRDLFKPAGA